MALWTPANLAVPPRRIRYGPNATFVGGNLTGWPNTGSDASNGTIAGTPTQGALYGGVQSVRFDAAAEQISHTLGAWSSGALSTFWFGKRLGGGVAAYFGKGWFAAGSAVGYLGTGIANFGSAHFGNGNGALGPQFKTAADVVNTSTPHIVSAKLGAVNALYVDGVAQTLLGSVTGLVPNYASAAWVGGNSGANGEHANADEIVGMEFDYALSDADRQKLDGWIAWATGWQSLLPANHPYKAAAPTTGGAPAVPSGPLAFDVNWATLNASTGYHVFAWWHVFRRSIDNLAPASDFYTTRMLNPTDPVYSGSSGTRGYGAWIPDRPSGRSPLAGADWQQQDAQFWCEQAWAVGIDGFQHNIISAQVGSADYNDIGNNLEGALRCTNAGKPFKIMLMLDGVILSQTPTDQIVAAVRAHMNHPRILRHPDGRLILGSFAPDYVIGLTRTTDIINGIAAGTAGVFFIPQFINPNNCTNTKWNGICEGAGCWGGNVLSTQPGLATIGGQVKAQGRQWMPTIFPQDYRPKEHMVREAGGSALYRLAWDNAVANRSASLSWLASIACWNDYTENHMGPSEPGLGVQEGFYRLTAYYAYLYKTGTAPTITRDQLFYFHRREHTSGYGAGGTGTAQPGPFIHDPSNDAADVFQNNIELVALLASPGRIRITLGGSSTFADVGPGLQRLSVPWTGNVTPVFSLERGGATLLTLRSAFPTRTQSQYQDLHYKAGVSEPFATSGSGGIGQAAGIGSASGVGRSTKTVIAGASGVGSAVGVGRATAAAVGISIALASVSGAGTSQFSPPIMAGDGRAVGTGAAAGVGRATAASVGTISSAASVVGRAEGVSPAAGAATGQASVAAVGEGGAVRPAVGAAASISTALAEGIAVHTILAGGLARGIATVSGVASPGGVQGSIDIDPEFVVLVPAERQFASVATEVRVLMVRGDGMILNWQAKDPDDTTKRGLDWTNWLAGENLVSSNWIIARNDGSIVIQRSEFTTKLTTVLMVRGRANRRYVLTNSILTDQGRRRDQSVAIRVTPA